MLENIVLLWLPWSWKGGLLKHIKSSAYWDHYDSLIMWDLFRSLTSKSNSNAIWERLFNIIDQWKLIQDDVAIKLFETFLMLKDPDKLLLSDGFPRSIIQYREFKKIMEQRNKKFKLRYLDVEKKLIIERMKERQRPGESDKIINNRIEEFYAITLPVVELADNDWLLHNIDSNGTKESSKFQAISILEQKL